MSATMTPQKVAARAAKGANSPNFFSSIAMAYAYFSTFPVGGATKRGAPAAGALLALPLVGATIGALAGGIGWGASLLLPAPLPAMLVFAVLMLASGAIHFDGFLDSCDALFAALAPTERREIFKDPRRGSFALAGAAVLVPLWIAGIDALSPAQWWQYLSFAGALARWGAILNGARIPYGSGGSAAQAFRFPIRWLFLGMWGILIGAAAAILLKPALGLVLLVAGLGLVIGEWARYRLGGVLVGDVYGAITVVLEVVTLIGLIALL